MLCICANQLNHGVVYGPTFALETGPQMLKAVTVLHWMDSADLDVLSYRKEEACIICHFPPNLLIEQRQK